jgi:non-ribosomal peptide synthetase component E (peptide arylation enzyme)
MGEVLRFRARILPDKIGACDLDPAMTLREWNARSCQLANALIGLGLAKGESLRFKSAGKLSIAYIDVMLALRIAI